MYRLYRVRVIYRLRSATRPPRPHRQTAWPRWAPRHRESSSRIDERGRVLDLPAWAAMLCQGESIAPVQGELVAERAQDKYFAVGVYLHRSRRASSRIPSSPIVTQPLVPIQRRPAQRVASRPVWKAAAPHRAASSRGVAHEGRLPADRRRGRHGLDDIALGDRSCGRLELWRARPAHSPYRRHCRHQRFSTPGTCSR